MPELLAEDSPPPTISLGVFRLYDSESLSPEQQHQRERLRQAVASSHGSVRPETSVSITCLKEEKPLIRRVKGGGVNPLGLTRKKKRRNIIRRVRGGGGGTP